jgi:hypothetical protein
MIRQIMVHHPDFRSYRQVSSRLAITQDGGADTHLRRAADDSKYYDSLLSAITDFVAYTSHVS